MENHGKYHGKSSCENNLGNILGSYNGYRHYTVIEVFWSNVYEIMGNMLGYPLVN
jgi:hypothetical protein